MKGQRRAVEQLNHRIAGQAAPGGVGRENGEAAFVADDASPSIRHERTGRIVRGGYDLREAVREIIAIGPSPLQRLTIFGSDSEA